MRQIWIKIPIHVARYCATKIYDDIFKDCSIAGKAQILRCLLVSKKLEGATSLMGIQKVTKESKLKHNVIENIGDAIKKIGKSRKKDTSDARRAIETAIFSASTRQKCLTTQLAQVVGTSRNTLYKHSKFRMQIDENNELSCWAIICREPYKDRMGEGVKDIVQKYRLAHARVSPNSRDVIQQRVSRNVYPKHIMEMKQVQLFNKFKEDHGGINMSITTFVQQKPWYVRPITIRDTCYRCYHLQF